MTFLFGLYIASIGKVAVLLSAESEQYLTTKMAWLKQIVSFVGKEITQ